MLGELANQKPTMKRLVVRPSPLQKQVGTQQQIIVLPSNLLLNSKGGQETILRLASAPSQPSKIIMSPSKAMKRPSTDQENQARKRANLDHLSPEEKLMRRKLKNRVAAQNARDKKRVKMDEIEIKLAEMEALNEKILAENASLLALNKRLQEENKMLLNGGGNNCPLTPPPEAAPVSPASSSMSDQTLVDSRSFESAEESGSGVGRDVDGYDDDYGTSSILSGSSGEDDVDDVQAAIRDIEFLLEANHAGNITPKEEECPTTPDPVVAAPSVNSGATDALNSFNEDVIKMENNLDFDDCFSELFPDLDVSNAGIVF